MKAIRYMSLGSAVLLLTWVFAHLWLNSSWSESVWSRLNHWLEGGQNPGLSSDVELAVSLVCAFVLAALTLFLLLKLSKIMRG
jgi:hypothetical protein